MVGGFWFLVRWLGFIFGDCGFCGLLVVLWVVQQSWGGGFGQGDGGLGLHLGFDRNLDGFGYSNQVW